jgi:GNAT superfamily N-acetyltransferase
VEIRPATENDIPAIVGLLKMSLGEGLMPKSEAFWRWKHVDNPFGPSPVLLAEVGGELVGVRAFMRWEWMYKRRVYRAVRAVDTATHPDHQGKGIFTKLTLALVDQCRREGTDFIFNTPNEKSRPGYLKMGWKQVGRLPITIGLNFFLGLTPSKPDEQSNLSEHLAAPGLQRLLDEHMAREEQMTTRYTLEYLRWRYENNPNIAYFTIADSSGSPSFLLICRVKKGRVGKEFRVCEALGDFRSDNVNAKNSIRKKIKRVHAMLLACSGTNVLPLPTAIFAVGPHVTSMALHEGHERPWQNFDHWKPSLGDLEVF